MAADLRWEDVVEGAAIPAISLKLSLKRMIMAVGSTRDFAPVHHDREFARASGNRDIFVNVTFVEAFVGRCLTDWTGPAGNIRKLRVSIKVPNYLGDTVTASGNVTKKYVDNGEHRVDCQLAVKKQDGTLTVDATATMAFPRGA